MVDKKLMKLLRARRARVVIFLLAILLSSQIIPAFFKTSDPAPQQQTEVLSETTQLASHVMSQLWVKGRASKTGYSRSEFGDGWGRIGDCDLRNLILQRDLRQKQLGSDNCVVLRGTLDDPYTAMQIEFLRGSTTSDDVQIDHVVALSDAWQKGAQALTYDQRVKFANDPLNLLAVDGSANQQKSNGDTATWLPSNKSYRCRYVARQIAVKKKYNLWITEAERAAMQRVLNSCKDQPLPFEEGSE